MSNHLTRAVMLMERSRPESALEELQQHFAEFPDDAYAHSLQSRCLTDLERFDDAIQAAQTAIRLAPDSPFGHYTLAAVWAARRRFAEAQTAIDEAIRLDPDDPDHYALLAQILLQRRRWSEALAAAQEGLALDPEHDVCNNLRALALVRLGRREQAGQTIEAVLARNPEDSFSHANQGWTLLQQGQPQRALEHFRESLRIDPTCSWAREGIVESLKARNIIYRWLLAWFFWMARLPPRLQFGIVIVGFFGFRYLSQLAAAKPDLQPWLLPICIAYVIFALMTWIADPLFNLLLRLDKDGRHALSADQVQGANALGICLVLALGSLVWFLTMSSPEGLSFAFLFGLGLIPLTSIWRCQTGWPRTAMLVFTIVFFVSGAVVRLPLPKPALVPFALIHLPMMYLAPWVANGLQFARVTR